jgi:2,4-dienoyl-CoA reductase-like NADH-dependent reductase (Old Yellow Enzyme family)
VEGGHYDAKIAENPAELEAFLTPLADAGVSIFHPSTRRYWLPAFEGDDRTLAGWTKHLTGRPVIAIGSVGVASAFRGEGEAGQASLTLAPLITLAERGEFDLVATGRAVLADPEWAAKVATGRLEEIRPYEASSGAVLY